MTNSKAILAMILAASLWGTTYTVVKIGLSILNPPLTPMGFLFLRFLIAFIIVAIPMLSSNKTRLYIKEVLTNKLVICLGLVNAMSYIVQFIGQKGVSVGIATLFINLYLVSTPIFAWIILHEMLTNRTIISLALSMIGVVLISLSNFFDAPLSDVNNYILSAFLVFFSGIIWGGYAVISKLISNESKKIGSQALSNAPCIFLVSNFYSIIIIFLSMVFLNQPPDINELNLIAWVAIIYLAIFGTIIPFVLTIYASQTLKATEINIITILNVIVGLVIAFVVLKEEFSSLAMVGGILIVIAIYAASTSNVYD